MPPRDASAADVQERVERLEKAVRTLAWWLVQAQTGFNSADARGIERILETGSHSED